ncbi:MAG TPA: class I SAM-dependent methyltransferase [Candidatus Nanoarchaeia archaeon]|nr:class I SAM-dependent methyltransferase [Candidatus Nanoarchaeia archaeon]
MQKFNKYYRTHDKPDKKYSMLPTVIKLCGSIKNKTLIDIGCGDGFFTKNLARDSKKIYGIDIAKEAIESAKRNSLPNTNYIIANMNNFDYPKSDIIVAPFVLNYEKYNGLSRLFKKFYNSLNQSGKIVCIFDMPNSTYQDSREYGSIKEVTPKLKEGAVILIHLYNKKYLMTLSSFFHTKENIEKLLKEAGFNSIKWFKPIVSSEGIKLYGKEFWKNYIKNCDVSYLVAKKY